VIDEVRVAFRKPLLLPGEASVRLFAHGAFEVRNAADELCQSGALAGPATGPPQEDKPGQFRMRGISLASYQDLHGF